MVVFSIVTLVFEGLSVCQFVYPAIPNKTSRLFFKDPYYATSILECHDVFSRGSCAIVLMFVASILGKAVSWDVFRPGCKGRKSRFSLVSV